MYIQPFLIFTHPWQQLLVSLAHVDVRPTFRHHYVMRMVGEGHYLTGHFTPCTRARMDQKNTRKTGIKSDWYLSILFSYVGDHSACKKHLIPDVVPRFLTHAKILPKRYIMVRLRQFQRPPCVPLWTYRQQLPNLCRPSTEKRRLRRPAMHGFEIQSQRRNRCSLQSNQAPVWFQI